MWGGSLLRRLLRFAVLLAKRVTSGLPTNLQVTGNRTDRFQVQRRSNVTVEGSSQASWVSDKRSLGFSLGRNLSSYRVKQK
jgi:hypothetical protein